MATNSLLQVHAIAGQTTYTVPANLVPAGLGLKVDIAGTPTRYSFNSATSIVLATAATDRQIVNFDAVPQGYLTRDVALDFPSIGAASQANLTASVPGAAVGDVVDLGLPAAPAAGITWDAFVSAADTVTVRATNVTAGAVDPASAVYRLMVDKA